MVDEQDDARAHRLAGAWLLQCSSRQALADPDAVGKVLSAGETAGDLEDHAGASTSAAAGDRSVLGLLAESGSVEVVDIKELGEDGALYLAEVTRQVFWHDTSLAVHSERGRATRHPASGR